LELWTEIEEICQNHTEATEVLGLQISYQEENFARKELPTP
jgi:hypothetical protein